MNRTREEALVQFQNKHNLSFINLTLLDRAFTHSSWCNESENKSQDNQRLEFLGDSVLGLVINHNIYVTYEHFKEGELSRLKSAIVSEGPLVGIAQRLGIGDLLLLGKGELQSGGKRRESNLADALEALIAAIYLDQGLEACNQFILEAFESIIKASNDPLQLIDFKTSLQEALQKQEQGLPEYKVISSKGPDHKKQFEVAVFVKHKEIERGVGASIKKAQTEAARKAMIKLKLEANL